MGEIITVDQRIKYIEETQSRDEVKQEENSSKTAIIKILSENINLHITHSCNTFNSSFNSSQNNFIQTQKYPNNAPFRPSEKLVKPNKSKITENDTDIVSPNRFESLKSDTGSFCFQNKTDNTYYS